MVPARGVRPQERVTVFAARRHYLVGQRHGSLLYFARNSISFEVLRVLNRAQYLIRRGSPKLHIAICPPRFLRERRRLEQHLQRVGKHRRRGSIE